MHHGASTYLRSPYPPNQALADIKEIKRLRGCAVTGPEATMVITLEGPINLHLPMPLWPASIRGSRGGELHLGQVSLCFLLRMHVLYVSSLYPTSA